MNVSSTGAAAADWPQNTYTSSPASSAPVRELQKAIRQVNRSSILPDNRELSLSFDPKTKIPVVRVLDATTHEVLDQLPAEYMLRVTAFLQSEAAQESLSNNSTTTR